MLTVFSQTVNKLCYTERYSDITTSKPSEIKWGLNQNAFTQLLGINKGMLSQYEVGNNLPKIRVLIRLENYTGISVKTLCLQLLDREAFPDVPLEGGGAGVVEEAEVVMGEYEAFERRVAALEKMVGI